MPRLTLVAGPNGAGKSTIARYLLAGQPGHWLDPDAIARELSPDDPSQANIAAGRVVLERSQAYLTTGQNFILETTLSGKRELDLIKTAREQGFEVYLIYIALDSPDRHISRVQERVAQGGHAVSEEDIRRRYTRSLAHLADALPLVQVARVYDNSGRRVRKIIETRDGIIVWQSTRIPRWVLPIIAQPP